MTPNQKRSFLAEVLNMDSLERRESGIKEVGPKNSFPENYRGLVFEVNDHGTCTLLRCFKNGNTRIIADCV